MVKPLSAQTSQSTIPITYPPESEIKVEVDQQVEKNQLLTVKPAPSVRFDIAQKLKISVDQIDTLLKKQIGDSVETGEILIEKKGWFRARKIISHVSGTLVSLEQGVLQLQIISEPEEVHSPLAGKIIHINEDEHLIQIECPSESLETEWTWGPLVWGRLTAVGGYGSELELERIKGDYSQQILIISGQLTKALWHKLSTLGTTGLISGRKPDGFEHWFDEEAGPENHHGHPSIAVAPSIKKTEDMEETDPKFAQSVWEWFNDRVGRIAVLDGDNKKISICKE